MTQVSVSPGEDVTENQSTCSPFSSFTPPQRDEKKEIRRVSRRETQIIRLWRVIVTLVHLAVATTVTITTFRFLEEAQDETFLTAFEQFARTVETSAIQHQSDIRAAYRGLAESIEVSAIHDNATWPFYTMPFFEKRAGQARQQSRSETFTFAYVVQTDQLDEWNQYAAANYEAWVKEGHMLQSGNLDRLRDETNYRGQMFGFPTYVEREDFHIPTWSYSPPPTSYGLINWDTRSTPQWELLVQAVNKLQYETVAAPIQNYALSLGVTFTKEEHDAMHSGQRFSDASHPHFFLGLPVHENLDPESKIVGFLAGSMGLDAALRYLLPPGIELTTVIYNTCDQVFTYELIGEDAFFVGEGDLHDTSYDRREIHVNLFEGLYTHPDFETTEGHCQYFMSIYPSDKLRDEYVDKTPAVFAAIVASTFVLVAIVFLVYDIMVQRRNEKMVTTAARSGAVVTSLFPGRYRDEMVSQMMDGTDKSALPIDKVTKIPKTKPLADLFLETTILFADIAGFTAWSSVREPHQVFTLLESVYGSFDRVAKRRGIYKVETVGDCYVAAAGIPKQRKDHAVAMCRFARDILMTMNTLAKDLVVVLGPDTGDLTIRVGIHSGPVTAGVLRGERARFQLFGDTMNTTSRMESTSTAGKIQLSVATTELLIKAGKGSWVRKREDRVVAKGKGELETYWLKRTIPLTQRALAQQDATQSETSGSEVDGVRMNRRYTNSSDSENSKLTSGMDGEFDEKTASLIDWNADVLGRLLSAVVLRRIAKPTRGEKVAFDAPSTGASSFLDEVVEIIHLPDFEHQMPLEETDRHAMCLPKQATEQLRHYVATIASMYRDNPFHSFEHASHVMMSVNKLMSRIVAPSLLLDDPNDLHTGSDHSRGSDNSRGKNRLARIQAAKIAATLHDHTYGITSDPLTHFACAVSALIHDVDHQGVPNAQLVMENDEVATMYEHKSPAEQNSLELAWNLLMEETYSDLRLAIYGTEEERKRFRQLLVNSVMATDIADKELKALRNFRWDKAFKEGLVEGKKGVEEPMRDSVNRKATIVLEHLIQASDVSHTMQHWHIYRRWNENFFRECYKAYRYGRAETDPSLNWYEGELGFFDFYIIPLAKKLKECGVFGKSSGEYLNYATENRNEWEQRGKEVTKEMVLSFEEELKEASQKKTNGIGYYSDDELEGSANSGNTPPRRDSRRGRG